MSDPRYNVLFLCTQNSARSLISEVLLNETGGDTFKAYSAGSQPKGEPHPRTLEMLKRNGHDISGLRSKSWEEFAQADAPKMDFVFTVCDQAARETCPIWPGQPISAHWGIPDPAAATGTDAEINLAFADAYKQMANRISLLTNLPIASLDRLKLQQRLDEIGRKYTKEASI